MSKRGLGTSRAKEAAASKLARNAISEWFGHQVFGSVARGDDVFDDQVTERCPFLSAATLERRKCIKSEASRGVCTVSAAALDWPVCPYRALDDQMLATAVGRLFAATERSHILAAPALARADARARVRGAIENNGRAFVYLQNNLGGEISLPKTDRSPEISFDITIAELVGDGQAVRVSRYAILEVQTMDFHGSYKGAVTKLKAAIDLYKNDPDDFADALTQHQEWLSEKIEGPNIANVFKRTLYQALLKFQLAGVNGSLKTS